MDTPGERSAQQRQEDIAVHQVEPEHRMLGATKRIRQARLDREGLGPHAMKSEL